jgi:hypothetical protein
VELSEVAFLRGASPHAITAIDVSRIRKEVESFLIPLARIARVVAPSQGFNELVQLYRPEDPSFGTHPSSQAKEFALDSLTTAAAWIALAEKLQRGEIAFEPSDEYELEKDEPDWKVVTSAAAGLTAHTFGYLSALVDSRNDIARRGSDGRRLIGATTRERVRNAAADHRGKLTKDAASVLISDLIGKSIGHVRRVLTKEFPGDSWGNPESDTSTDLSGQDHG